MPAERQNEIEKTTQPDPISIRWRQQPLRELYDRKPTQALITDSARTTSDVVPVGQPLYSNVTCGTGLPADLRIGVHKALGGKSDLPVPGELFAAAIASCLDSATRMIANLLEIRLEHLEVTVDAGVDVRGTLQMDRHVPVGFQTIDVDVRISGGPGVTEAQLERLMDAAERSCVVLQTLQNPPEIRVRRESGNVL